MSSSANGIGRKWSLAKILLLVMILAAGTALAQFAGGVASRDQSDKKEKAEKKEGEKSEKKKEKSSKQDDDDEDDKEKSDEREKAEKGSEKSAKREKSEKKKDQTTPASAAPAAGPEAVGSVVAIIETQPVPQKGDAADDPAIWVNPEDPAQSTIIGTDKRGGLAVYDLTGKQLQYLPDGKLNNVDLRAGFPLGGQSVTLVTAGNRSDNTIAIYRVNPATRMLEHVAARKIVTTTTYGSCMYRSPRTGKFYYFVNSKAGDVEQWELFDQGSGKVDAKKVRSFKVQSQPEGCVADDELGHLYIGEEAAGIWKYDAEPEAGTSHWQVDKTGPGGHLVADVEGLAIVYGKDGTGYLIASSQGNNSFVIYRREGDNAYVRTFRIVAGNGVDGVEDTDGIEVTTANLGPAFPDGVFVAQDGVNDSGNQNFKLVPWHLIIGKPQAAAPGGSTVAK